MKNIVALLFLFLLCLGVQAQPIQRNYFTTNVNPQLNITNGNLISTNIYVSNLYATNITVNTFNGKTTITTNLYVTNAFISYLTNNTFYTTNVTEQFVTNNLSYITNLYGPFITNNTLYSTNIYTTNLFATYVTNNTDYITNLYGPFITNDFIYTTNIFNSTAYVTNLYGPFITNFQLYSTDIFVTNLTANYITNLQTITTNLFVSNAFVTNLTVEFITNDFLFVTNLYNSNAFITNLTVQNITNNTLITTNAFISNAFITNITIFEAQWDTNKWVGPTNDIDFSFGTYQKFKASTDMEITGLKGVNPTNENTTVLLLDPGGATRTLYFPNNWTNYTLDKGNAYTIGSTNIAIVTLSQYGQENTNVLVRIWGVIPTPTTAQVWSNYQGFIFPAGEPAPDTTAVLPGPSVFFRSDGALFVGTNVVAQVDPTDPLNSPFNATLYTASNQPNTFQFQTAILDSTAGNWYSILQGSIFASPTAPFVHYGAKSEMTNEGFREDGWTFKLRPDGSSGGTTHYIYTNSVIIFQVDKDGQTTANGFTDKSFAANGVVTNDSTGLLHTTPTLPSTLLPTDLAYVDQNNSWTSASSNYVNSSIGYATNSNNTTPDFQITGSESLLSTNNNFTWLAPIHIDTSGKVYQFIVIDVTNSSGSSKTMTLPNNVHNCNAGAGLVVTNFSKTFWEYWPPSGPTNFYHIPGY